MIAGLLSCFRGGAPAAGLDCEERTCAHGPGRQPAPVVQPFLQGAPGDAHPSNALPAIRNAPRRHCPTKDHSVVTVSMHPAFPARPLPAPGRCLWHPHPAPKRVRVVAPSCRPSLGMASRTRPRCRPDALPFTLAGCPPASLPDRVVAGPPRLPRIRRADGHRLVFAAPAAFDAGTLWHRRRSVWSLAERSAEGCALHGDGRRTDCRGQGPIRRRRTVPRFGEPIGTPGGRTRAKVTCGVRLRVRAGRCRGRSP